MIKLINGKGQLGTELAEQLKTFKCDEKKDILIYHTWNVWDKTENAQVEEYEKFTKFVDENKNKVIVFISTAVNNKSFYLTYKRKAEQYLIDNYDDYLIVLLPNMIGKGICQKFRDENVEPHGIICIGTRKEYTKTLLLFLEMYLEERIGKIRTVTGFYVPANIVKELILFGKDDKQ